MNTNSDQRLKHWRRSVDLSQRDLAAALGVSQGFVGNLEAGRSEPSRNFLQRLSEVFRVNPAWVLEGREPMTFDAPVGFETRSGEQIDPVDRSRPLRGDFAVDGEDFSLIQRLDLSVSAGTGLEAVDGAMAERLAFSRTWLMRNHVSADLSALVRVKGDSMDPTIPDGALVLVHAAEMTIHSEAIYAFIRNGEAFIKRIIPVSRDTSGKATSVVIYSDNKAYPPDVVVGEDMNTLRIVGRVRGVMFSV